MNHSKTCPICSSEFFLRDKDPANFARQKFCSIACRGKACRGKEIKSCKRCGKTMTQQEYTHFKRNIYCSHACALKSQERPIEERFWEKVKKTSECWLWTAAVDRKGYGRIGLGPDLLGAHRYSWELAYGPIPDGMAVLHHCDNPLCVRPEHLWLGTIADNNRDMIKKGRAWWQKK